MYSNIEIIRCIEWDAQQSIADSRREGGALHNTQSLTDSI